MPTPPPEPSEGQPTSKVETPPLEQIDAQAATSSSIESKNTPTASEEGAPPEIDAGQVSNSAKSEKIDGAHITDGAVGGETVEGNDHAGDPSASSVDAKADAKSTKKARRKAGDKLPSGGELSDEDSRYEDDTEDEIPEEENVASAVEGQKKRAPERIRQFQRYFEAVEYRMNYVENELKKLKGDESKPQSKEDAKENVKGDAKEDDKETPKKSPEFTPTIRRLDWAEFKPSSTSDEASEYGPPEANPRLMLEEPKAKVSGDQHESGHIKHQHHVLEVLMEDPKPKGKRRGKKISDTKTNQGSDAAQVSKGALRCPERLRICSRPLLKILRTIINADDSAEWYSPHMMFFRPFKMFIFHQAEIRSVLKDMERKWQSKEESPPIDKLDEAKAEGQGGETEGAKDVEDKKDETSAPDPGADTEVKTDTFEALQHMRLLVEFLDHDLKPTFELRRKIEAREACQIAFADLWHLFNYGQEVRTLADELQVYRVVKFTGGRYLWSDTMPAGQSAVPPSCRDWENSNGSFLVECYSYNFDGTSYGSVNRIIEIRRYEGLKAITSLQLYPLEFDKEHRKEKEQLVQRGKKFMALARVNKTAHMMFHGRSLDDHAEEIESPVMVDFQLAIAKGKIKPPKLGFLYEILHDPRETWDDSGSCGFQGCDEFDGIFEDLWLDHKQSERYLADEIHDLRTVKEPDEVGADKLVLLPRSVHGFVLQSRKWRTFNIDEVKEIKWGTGFDDLVLPPGYKETVEALVNKHVRWMDPVGNRTDVRGSMDLVAGKGKGLIILLHGAPGVGKTSTAECVADKTKRPLFPLTCGDLGEKAMEVEENLEKNFALAHRWGCVLLLDEADVFLAVRNQTDLQRNAVVSVFLRTLEYYSGILFLTTNRVGVLDPAFKSRIHVKLHFPNLTKSVSTEIWRSRIAKAKEELESIGGEYILRKREILQFSKQNFKNLKRGGFDPWNGRQIRNAFQTAMALALQEAYIKGGKPQLTEHHFEQVARASNEFDRYLKMLHGRSESQIAKLNKTRTDYPDKKPAEIPRRQPPRGQPKSEDDSSESDSSDDDDSSDSDDTSSAQEAPAPKVGKKAKKKQKAMSDDEVAPAKKEKKGKAKQESTSEEVASAKKEKKGKANQESTSEEEVTSAKKGKREKKTRRKKRESSTEEEDSSSEEEKGVKKSAKGSKQKEKEKEKGKGKGKSSSKTFN